MDDNVRHLVDAINRNTDQLKISNELRILALGLHTPDAKVEVVHSRIRRYYNERFPEDYNEADVDWEAGVKRFG